MTEELVIGHTTQQRRTYARRAPLCRLCLHEYPRDELQEIFFRGSVWKKQILQATGIKAHRTDPATRLCCTCQKMVDLIVNFQEICHKTELLMLKSDINRSRPDGVDRWVKASGLIDNLWEVIIQHRETVMAMACNTVTSETEPDSSIDVSHSVLEDVYENKVKQEDEEPQYTEVEALEIKDEVLEENDEMGGDSDYHYEEDLQNNPQESDLEESEEDVKPKNRRSRSKQSEEKRQQLRNQKVMCDTCGELVSQICLEGHLNRHLGVKPFVCEIEGCGRRLYSKYSLQQHRHLHKSIMRYYDCPDCGKRIKGTNCWMRHRKLHTEEPKHECDVCGKKFRRKFGLKLHAVVHTGVALFPCEICGKRFTVKHNLGAHYKTHMRNGTYPGTVKNSRETSGE